SQIGVLPSLEVVVWVATGGRGTLIGALLGAVGINAARSLLTAYYPEWWPIILGSLFVGVVILFPDGLVGIPNQLRQRLRRTRAPVLGGSVADCVLSPATASAEGAQFNVPPFPASATAEGRQLNGGPAPLRERVVEGVKRRSMEKQGSIVYLENITVSFDGFQ